MWNSHRTSHHPLDLPALKAPLTEATMSVSEGGEEIAAPLAPPMLDAEVSARPRDDQRRIGTRDRESGFGDASGKCTSTTAVTRASLGEPTRGLNGIGEPLTNTAFQAPHLLRRHAGAAQF